VSDPICPFSRGLRSPESPLANPTRLSYDLAMQVVKSERVEHSGAISNHRGGNIDFRRLHRGAGGEPTNFEWSLIQTTADYTTPRHRHNFDQIHHILEGRHSWGPNQWMPTGSVGYFTEGCFYGPQQGGPSLQLGLQFGGATGSGFMSYDQLHQGNAELQEVGEFHDGMFSWVDADGKRHNADGYEAIWEHVQGQPVVYPEARYASPIIIYPDAMSWRPSREEDGVALKHVGTFGERMTSVRFVGLDVGAGYAVDASTTTVLHFVKSGAVRLNESDEVNVAGSAICWRAGETGWMSAAEASEIYEIRMPEFS
jgi:hypothetical protein